MTLIEKSSLHQSDDPGTHRRLLRGDTWRVVLIVLRPGVQLEVLEVVVPGGAEHRDIVYIHVHSSSCSAGHPSRLHP